MVLGPDRSSALVHTDLYWVSRVQHETQPIIYGGMSDCGFVGALALHSVLSARTEKNGTLGRLRQAFLRSARHLSTDQHPDPLAQNIKNTKQYSTASSPRFRIGRNACNP